MRVQSEISDIPFLQRICSELASLPEDPNFAHKLPPVKGGESVIGKLNPTSLRILHLFHTVKCKIFEHANAPKKRQYDPNESELERFSDELWTFLLVLIRHESGELGSVAIRQGGVLVDVNRMRFGGISNVQHATTLH